MITFSNRKLNEEHRYQLIELRAHLVIFYLVAHHSIARYIQRWTSISYFHALISNNMLGNQTGLEVDRPYQSFCHYLHLSRLQMIQAVFRTHSDGCSNIYAWDVEKSLGAYKQFLARLFMFFHLTTSQAIRENCLSGRWFPGEAILSAAGRLMLISIMGWPCLRYSRYIVPSGFLYCYWVNQGMSLCQQKNGYIIASFLRKADLRFTFFPTQR